MTIKIGLKIDYNSINSGILKDIAGFDFDYYEYPAPVLSLLRLPQYQKIDPLYLRPHSNRFSFALKDGINKSILSKIKDECILTKSEYLGVHLGQVSKFANSPSLGYLFPPVLDEKTIEIIADNVKYVQDYLEKPLALENPVFYTTNEKDRLSYAEFILKLSQKLPNSTG